MRKIFILNGGSQDDLIALIYLASRPDIKIVGIAVENTGAAHGFEGTKNIAALCNFLGLPSMPIAYSLGQQPISKPYLPFPNYFRQMADNILHNKLDPIYFNNFNNNPNAIELLYITMAQSLEKITILVTGPLTNLAQFFILYPNLVHKIERIVIMGGALNVPGNIQELDPNSVNTQAEWNILADPQAADIIFNSGMDTTLVPLDATNQVPITKSFYQTLSESQNQYVKLIFSLYKNLHDSMGDYVFFNTVFLRSPLAALLLTHPPMARYEALPVCVDIPSGKTHKTYEILRPIQVATKIVEPHAVLTFLQDSITSIHMPIDATQGFQKVLSFKEPQPQRIHAKIPIEKSKPRIRSNTFS
ncbi:MAG TPA: nucleoside hydrolase [Gammaproteobacteria bacterium]|nr:nucleoside hydrolase [Gammaproteobacteria bacterium]